jgi:hypothetical protein
VPGILPGQNRRSGAGSNRRPSAFQETLPIHIGPWRVVKQAGASPWERDVSTVGHSFPWLLLAMR